MFPYEDSETMSVCPYPKKNHLSFINISPTVVIDTSMESSLQELQHGTPKIFLFKKGQNLILIYILPCVEVLKSPSLLQC